MGYEREPRRFRQLTPLESELRVPEPPRRVRVTPWSRFRTWRARRRPPKTLLGALGLGLLRLAIAGGLGTVLAFLFAYWLDRPTHVGFYLAGAAALAVAFMSSAADMGTPYHYDRGEREYRVRASFSYALVGAILSASQSLSRDTRDLSRR
jgi:hypothetical protein